MNVNIFPRACEFVLPGAHVIFFQSHVKKFVKKFVKKLSSVLLLNADPEKIHIGILTSVGSPPEKYFSRPDFFHIRPDFFHIRPDFFHIRPDFFHIHTDWFYLRTGSFHTDFLHILAGAESCLSPKHLTGTP